MLGIFMITIYALSAIFVSITIIFLVIYYVKKYNKKEYERNINVIETYTRYWTISVRNFGVILILFKDISLNNQDLGRTQEAWVVFMERYQDIYDELDPSSKWTVDELSRLFEL